MNNDNDVTGAQPVDSSQNCDNIIGVAVPNNSEQVALTMFLNDACDQVSIRSAAQARVPEMYDDVPNVTTLSEYFARPQRVWQGALTPSVTPITIINLTNSWIQSNLYNFSRVSGAFGYRGTLVFRLQVVATPFQAGRIKLAFSPLEDAAIFSYDRLSTIAPISQLPGVELDLAETTSVILKIPFIHAYNYFNVVASAPIGGECLGALGVFPMLGPLLATGDSSPRGALWFHLEDLELVAAGTRDYVAQSGKVKKLTASSKESMAVQGNFSNVLAAGSNVATWLSGIPFISAFAGKAAWVLREGANIAASYGWARPVAVLPYRKVWTTVNNYQANCDAPDVAHSLGLFSANEVEPLVGFAGCDVDEMSLNYIKSVPTVIRKFSMLTTDASNAVLWSTRLTPSAFWYQNTTNKNVSISTTLPNANSGLSIWPSSLFALAQVCSLWRGGFKFRVKCAKTKFHTGRLVLGFIPTPLNNTAATVSIPTTISTLQYPSVVWDLRESNDIVFDVPFVSQRSFLSFGASFGTFFISVLEPLQGPTTVSTTIDFCVEVAGLPDFEVAWPNEVIFPPAPLDTLYVAQSGGVIATAPSDASNYCIGERILSVKQFISRSTPITWLTTSGANAYGSTWLPGLWAPSAAAATSLTGPQHSYINYFMSFYGMYRGGTTFDTISNGADNTVTASIQSNVSGTNLAGRAFYTETSGANHFKIPYYSATSRTIVGAQSVHPAPPNLLLYLSKKTGDTTSIVYVQKRASDDFQLGYYLGAPPLAIPFNTSPSPGANITQALSTAR